MEGGSALLHLPSLLLHQVGECLSNCWQPFCILSSLIEVSAEETGSDLHLRFTACSFELHLRKGYRLTDAIIKYHLWNVLMMHCAAVSFCPGALSQVWSRAESFNRFECLILRVGLGSLVFKVCLRLRESKMWLRKHSINGKKNPLFWGCIAFMTESVTGRKSAFLFALTVISCFVFCFNILKWIC